MKVDPPQVDYLVCGNKITKANKEGITGDDSLLLFVKVNVMHGYTELVLGYVNNHMQHDFGKPTKLSQLVFQEIPILNIQATVVPLC